MSKVPNPPPPPGAQRPAPPPSPPEPGQREAFLPERDATIICAGVWLAAWMSTGFKQAGSVSPETMTRCADECLRAFQERFPEFDAIGPRPPKTEA